MKLVSYAGQQLLTTDDVAEALVTLAASLANEGESQAVEIPILVDGDEDRADLVIGVGNDVLVGPSADTHGPVDFSADADRLRSHPRFPREGRTPSNEPTPDLQWDPHIADDIDLELEPR